MWLPGDLVTGDSVTWGAGYLGTTLSVMLEGSPVEGWSSSLATIPFDSLTLSPPVFKLRSKSGKLLLLSSAAGVPGQSKHPPAEPEALCFEPLKAAISGAVSRHVDDFDGEAGIVRFTADIGGDFHWGRLISIPC